MNAIWIYFVLLIWNDGQTAVDVNRLKEAL